MKIRLLVLAILLAGAAYAMADVDELQMMRQQAAIDAAAEQRQAAIQADADQRWTAL